MTNIEVISFIEKVNKLRQSGEILFPTKVAFAIMRNLRKLLPIAEDCEQAKRDLIMHYGKEAEGKEGTYQILPEYVDKVNEELKNLFNMEAEDIKLNKIKLEDLDNMDLTLDWMEVLYPMIEEE